MVCCGVKPCCSLTKVCRRRLQSFASAGCALQAKGFVWLFVALGLLGDFTYNMIRLVQANNHPVTKISAQEVSTIYSPGLLICPRDTPTEHVTLKDQPQILLPAVFDTDATCYVRYKKKPPKSQLNSHAATAASLAQLQKAASLTRHPEKLRAHLDSLDRNFVAGPSPDDVKVHCLSLTSNSTLFRSVTTNSSTSRSKLCSTAGAIASTLNRAFSCETCRT